MGDPAGGHQVHAGLRQGRQVDRQLRHRLGGVHDDQCPDLLGAPRDLGDRHGEGKTFTCLGVVYQYQSRWEEAIACYRDAHWDTDELHRLTAALADRHGLKLAKAQAPIRAAVTGRSVGPPLFESLHLLGRERTMERLARAKDQLSSSS